MDGELKLVARQELKLLVAEASQALARLDAVRLEELALSCAALNREARPLSVAGRRALADEAREASGEMAILARVLEATRSNLRVMNRLRELRMGRQEYEERPDLARPDRDRLGRKLPERGRPDRDPMAPEWISEGMAGEAGGGRSHGHD